MNVAVIFEKKLIMININTSAMKLDVVGSNDDIENIIQGYINDLKLKDKYDTVMNELDMVMHDKPRCVLVKYFGKIKGIIGYGGIYYCKRCKRTFCALTTSNVECDRCMIGILRDGELYSGDINNMYPASMFR